MDNRTINYLEMLIRVKEFINGHGIEFPPGSHAKKQFDIINDVIRALTEQNKQITVNGNRVKQDTSTKKGLRVNLTKMLTQIRISARAIDNTNPGFAASFAKSRKTGDQALLAESMAALSNAEPKIEEFYKRAMAQDFMQRFKDTINAFEEFLGSKAAAKNSRINATAGTKPLIDKATLAMDDMNAIINNSYEHDPAMLKEWESASHPKQLATKKKPTANKSDKKKATPEQPPLA